jgi:hypothetical protein
VRGLVGRVAIVLVVAATVGFSLTGRLSLPTWPPAPRPTPTRAPRAVATAPTAPTVQVEPTAAPTREPPPTATAEGPNFIVLRARELTPDARLNVVGQGFVPSEQLAAALESPTGEVEAELAPLAADPAGRLNDAGIELPPNLASGEHRLRLEGMTSGRVVRASFRLSRTQPKIELEQYSIKSDSDVSVSGVGFAANEVVEVRLGGLGGEPLARLRAGPAGELVAQPARVPLVQPGDYPLYVVGTVSQTPASVVLNVRGFTPWVVLDNYSPPPYYNMGFKGEDFAPGEEVLVYLRDRHSEPAARVYADETGRFDIRGVLPLPELHGDTPLIFVGGITRKEMTATFNALGFQPGLELTEYAGRPGTMVGFIGTQWAREDRLRAYVGDVASGGIKRQEVATFSADPNGEFQAGGTFRLPATTKAGGLPLTVVGDVSEAEVTIWFEVLQLKPSAELTAYRGPSGTSVSFGGNGFAGGESVTVHLRTKDGQVLARATADDDGSFPLVGSFTVEGEPDAEAVAFLFVGDDSKAEAMTHFKVVAR